MRFQSVHEYSRQIAEGQGNPAANLYTTLTSGIRTPLKMDIAGGQGAPRLPQNYAYGPHAYPLKRKFLSIWNNEGPARKKPYSLKQQEEAKAQYEAWNNVDMDFQERLRPCSGRDEMCLEVLNDDWASHPTWASEDSGFVAHRKNMFEESLHRIEEERHDYDFNIEANAKVIQLLEPIGQQILSMTPSEREKYRMPIGLGGQSQAIYKRVMKKVYGERGPEVVADLFKDPCAVLPIVLARLKQKDEEWRFTQVSFPSIPLRCVYADAFCSASGRKFGMHRPRLCISRVLIIWESKSSSSTRRTLPPSILLMQSRPSTRNKDANAAPKAE
jgi:hypothetical protein